ncbi:hypothetical protein K431DRAFT_302079 [Polychaeton citri CBS 116435]|uniref:Uncharacterized protein n=1 Tax=Polychaeton citri CBS 116435 TaxID=1314669 RepID=A0A9P4QE43_9PEZI|nr:hypothetical protein K431DRAFT_302079 [Polychaeton citri CBS 116435]
MGLLERSKSIRRRDLSNTGDDGQNEVTRPSRKGSLLRRRSSAALKPKFEHSNPLQRPKTAERDNRSFHHYSEDVMPFTAGQYVFNFPTPSPRLSSFSVNDTPESNNLPGSPSPLDLSQCTTPIGVAIGSPSQMPSWSRSYTADHIRYIEAPTQPIGMSVSTGSHHVEASNHEAPLRRQRTWNRLGGLFRRKSSRRKPTMKGRSQQLQSPETSGSWQPSSQTFLEDAHTPPGNTDATKQQARHSRTPSQRHVARWQARAEADREIFHPTGEASLRRTPSMMMRDSPLLSPGSCASPTPSRDLSENRTIASPDTRATIGTPKLDIDIPSIELERYSIMFDKIFTPQQSLLERRMNRLEAKGYEQPASSTMSSSSRTLPQRSLSTMQAPSTPGNASLSPGWKTAGLPRLGIGLQRSNTAPGGVSPARANFVKSLPTVKDEPVSPVSATSAAQEEKSLPCTPVSFADDDSIVVSKLNGPKRWLSQREPSWEMLRKPAVSCPPVTTKPAHGPRIRENSHQTADERIVQVSIARQVSVSKARQKVQEASQNKQQVQSLRPRVVEVNKNGALRKSTVVVIEED